MSEQPGSERQRSMLREALDHADLTLEQLWLRYFALGGTAGQYELEAYLEELMPLPALERDMLAIAVNERLDELAWPHRVPYANSVREPLPSGGAFTALVNLLEAARNMPSEQLPALAARAGRALGVEISMYLVDDEQRLLVPVTHRARDSGSDSRVPLAIDTTLAGQAFRQVATMLSEADGTARLWVPLLDDIERLGVLEVVLDTPRELHDPALRQNCEWLATMLAHLVIIATRYGDRLDAERRVSPRLPAAELIWTLAPPTTAAVPGIIVAAATEPSRLVRTDVFDYALSADTAQLGMFDARGSTFRAGLLAATVLAASRAARREGHGLVEQAKAVDHLIGETFGADIFATGILAELDLCSGVLRYLSAGHPHPLLLRDGKIVKRLRSGRRMPFGIGSTEAPVAEEQLEPGDWIVLRTDGVTDAGGGSGTVFGDQRLIDFLEREAATRRPPPETVRRLIHAVLDYHRGQLDDDATVLLARWEPAER